MEPRGWHKLPPRRSGGLPCPSARARRGDRTRRRRPHGPDRPPRPEVRPAARPLARPARVHDIGRLPMPESTDAHFIAGQKILARKPALLPLATLVRSMNERWNGSGVPDGLSGSAIPLATRIVAVCETFDSLTNPLDGAEPMSTGGAILELVERAGTDLDPGVVEPFRDLVLEMDHAAKN